MLKRYAVVPVLFLFAILSFKVSAQIPIASIIGGTLTVNGTLITHQTGSSYTFEVTRTDGSSFSPQAATAGIEESGAYIIEIPMYHSTTQPGGAHAGDPAVIHVYRNGQELTVLSPPQGQITIRQEGTVEEINLNAQVQEIPSSPTANAGPDQTVDSGAQVTLDGSASQPATSGGVLTYAWTQQSGTAVSLSNSAIAKPVFTAPTLSAGGEMALVFQLTVKDPNNATASDTVTIKVQGPSENHRPEAKAGSAQTVYAGNTVALNGSGSSDPDANEILTFLWEQTQGIQVLLSDTGAVQPTFIAPDPGQGGEAELTFMLTVTDAAGQWDSDTVTITVLRLTANRAPLANAGPAQTVREGDTVILDGSNSTDPDNGADSGIVSWSWRQTDGTAVSLSNAGKKQASFTAPPVSASGESLTFELTVTDTGGLSDTDSVIINVISDNEPPVASAGSDLTVNAGEQVTLDASASSDPDGAADIASYEWRQILGKTVSLSNPEAVRPVFTAPATGNGGIALRFELTVTDKGGLKSSAEVTVNVVSPDNQPPSAHAGSDQSVEEGKEVMLDGSASTDPENSISLHIWRQIGGIPVTLSDAKKISPTFTAPDVARGGDILTFELTVVDSGGLMDSDRVTVTVSYVSRNPVADAGGNQTVWAGEPVFLDGSGSRDSDGWITSYLWAQISGTPVTISDPIIPEPSFAAPNAPGETLIFRLTVVDNEGLQDSAQTVITIAEGLQPPVASAGADRTVDEGSTVVLDGSGSYAQDGIIKSYRWTQMSGPSAVFLESASVKKTSVVAPSVTTGGIVLVFQLLVTDSSGMTGTDEVRLTVRDFGPGPGDDGGSCFIKSISFP
ncbi:MAG: PKD domain-containing protein [Desulfobacterales bacterium]